MEQSEAPAQNDTDCVEISTSRVQTVLALPPEIVLRIADFLPTTSTASFALCNKGSAAQLGSRLWNLLSSLEFEDRLHFLSILSRDLPRHHACHGCIRLHLSSSIPQQANFKAPPQPGCCIPASARGGHSEDGLISLSNYYSPYSLRFSHVQLALKQHRHGLDHGISLSDLSHIEIQCIQGTVYLFSVDARIACDELVVRSQEWVLSGNHPREHFLSRTEMHCVCQHLMTYNADFGFDDRFTSLVRCRFEHEAADDECACMRLQQCLFNPMEYQIDVVDLEERVTATCATKWLNLGAGLTTRDSKWRGHNLSIDECVSHNLPLGSIRSSYESQEGASVDDLSAENKKRLSSSLCVVGRNVQLNMDGCNWKLAGDNIWCITLPEEWNITPSLFHRLLASASRTITQFIEALF